MEQANLNEAILENTRLNKAVLAKAQALNTNFKQANLTGACIEDWNINKQTKFDNVICEYIFLDKEKKQYSPNQGKFAPGEFTDFYHQAFKTIELIFANNLDWQGFLRSFQKEYLDIVNNSNNVIIATKEKYENQILSEEQLEAFIQQVKINEESIDTLKKSITSLYSSLSNKSEKTGDIIINLNLDQKLESDMQKIHQFHEGNGDNVGRDKKTTNIYNSPDFTQAAKDIQALLEQLDKSHDSNTTTGKMMIATQAIEHIENDNNLTKRIVSALRTGSISALEALLDHPAASFFIAALEDWQQTKK